jgi:alpha-L-fucosidase
MWLYYCWRHPGFDEAARKANEKTKAETGSCGERDFKVLPPECDPATHSMEEQIEFQKLQIAELMEKYRHFPEDNGYPGETCWCLEDRWFWNEGTKPKPAADIVAELNTANARNANFLLNVSPDRNGRLVDSSVEVLSEIGRIRAAG